MRTWVVELLVVAFILAGVVLLLGSATPLEWLGSAAVLATFGHSQVANRLAEKEAAKPEPEVECYRWLLFYWVLKESFWFIYFLLHHSYAALVGVVIFLVYPLWRRLYRKYYPSGQNSIN